MALCASKKKKVLSLLLSSFTFLIRKKNLETKNKFKSFPYGNIGIQKRFEKKKKKKMEEKRR